MAKIVVILIIIGILAIGGGIYYYQTRFKIAGFPTPYSKNEIDARFRDNNRIQSIRDIQMALEIFYQNASLYVFPSLCEGFGLPPLEAMSFGVPVACSSATCLPEILGESAAYFDPYNPNEIAAKINQIFSEESLRQELINKGFEQIKKYSWRKTGEETQKIYLDP